MNKNILITGTSGYVGSHLAESLEQAGNTVKRLSVKNSLWKKESFKDIDVIIHTAALVHNNEPNAKLEDYFRINMQLPKELATKAKNDGVSQFVFMSTMAVYGEDGDMGRRKEISNPFNINPVTDYGISKAKAEDELLKMDSAQFKVVVVRPPMIYGANSPGNFSKLKKVAKILPIIPKINNSRSALYIKHLEKFIKEIVSRNNSGIYHPKDSFDFNTTKVITEIRKSKNKKTVQVPIPKMTYPLLNKVKVISKLYGNLVYGKDLYLHEEKIQINEQDFQTIIKDIMSES
ncbi:NAD-dependent epimerase/dehydratase family protein [Staphylococcus caledonicus]|uniref:NAD-dependent epimerase/dehydratase family protein n=1 Tax=Staphylococcus caledonicus TaxID=2741333 RepID=UPI0018E483A0|nr:NAD-dependent epimerase/dehydratase family protein [Staphylococcus caledonicus]MBI5973003.1 NAD-dependent epimerase/dehydratase family protein [Staphylococcus caledonicus]